MGEAQCHNQVLALLYCTVTNALDFQLLGEAFRNAVYHVGNQGSGQAVQTSVLLIVGRTGNQYFAVLNSYGQVGVEGLGHGALGALDSHFVAVYSNLYAGRDSDRLSTNSRHIVCTSFTRRMPELRRPRFPCEPACLS